MLRPSYSELMDVLNNDSNVDMTITSRYTIVIAASKRARQLVSGSAPLATAQSDKAVSIAINEMVQGKINISISQEPEEPAYDSASPGYGVDYLSQEDLGFE